MPDPAVTTPQTRAQWRRLIGELRPYRRPLACGIFCMLLAAPASLFHPLVWMFVVDRVLMDGAHDLLVPSLIVMVAVHGAGLALGACRDRFYETAANHFVRDLRERLFRKITGQTAGWMHRQRSGDLGSRVLSDVDSLQSSLLSGFTNLLDECVVFLIVLASVIAINWQVGCLTIVPLSLAFLIVSFFNRRIKELYLKSRRALGDIGARLQDALGGLAVLQAFGREENERERFRADNQTWLEQIMRAVRLRTTVFPFVFFVGFSTNVLMLGLGAWFVIQGEFTIGGLIAFRGFWWQLNAPIRTIAQVNDLLQRALASSTRIYEVLDAPVDLPEPAVPVQPANVRVPLRVDRVCFSYEPGRRVLHNLTFEIPPGSVTALAGRSGCGKSTLLQLIARFYDPESGEIFLGTTPLRAMNSRQWRSNLAIVGQDTFLFQTTVANNLRFGNPSATDAEMAQAARLANAHEFIESLPQGYETLVGERGVKLSGGQRQRLGVARAFLANPEILLLDEPTSSVEAESEAVIQASIAELMRGRTVLLTSHRPSLLALADRVVVMDHGRLIEQGSHTALLARGGPYSTMIRRWEESVGRNADD